MVYMEMYYTLQNLTKGVFAMPVSKTKVGRVVRGRMVSLIVGATLDCQC